MNDHPNWKTDPLDHHIVAAIKSATARGLLTWASCSGVPSDHAGSAAEMPDGGFLQLGYLSVHMDIESLPVKWMGWLTSERSLRIWEQNGKRMLSFEWQCRGETLPELEEKMVLACADLSKLFEV